MTDDGGWQQAYDALVLQGDQQPVARMFQTTVPLPTWVRHAIGCWLDPATDPNKSDRLVFTRSRRLARKMQANQDRLAIGTAFLEMPEGTPREEALATLSKEHGVSQSYIKRAATMARKLPTAFRDRAQQLPPVWHKRSP
jgi:hypothetical protein